MAKTSTTTEKVGPKLSELVGSAPKVGPESDGPPPGEGVPDDDFYIKPTGEERDKAAFDKINKRRSQIATNPAGLKKAEEETPPEHAGEGKPEKESEDGEEPAEVKKAKAFLRRKGYDPEYLESLPDDRALSLRARIGKREADIDAAFEERAQLQKRVAELEHGSPSTSGPAKSQVPPEDKRTDLSKEFSAIEQELGKDASSALARVIDTRMQEILSRVEPVLKSVKEESERRSGEEIAQAVREAREGLGERFPEFQDESEFSRVTTYMNHLAGLPKYRQTLQEEGREVALYELMIDAARLLDFEEVDDKKDAEEPEKAASNGKEKRERAASREVADERRPRATPLKGSAADWAVYRSLNQNRGNSQRVALARRAAGYG